MESVEGEGLRLDGLEVGLDFVFGRARSSVSLILLSTNRAIRNGTVAVPWDA